MIEHELRRDNQRPLIFDGDHIAEISSRRPWRDRWTTIDLYRTRGGSYVLWTRGHSDIDGEITFYRATTFGSAAAVVAGLESKNVISTLGWGLVELAAESEPVFEDAIEDYLADPIRIE